MNRKYALRHLGVDTAIGRSCGPTYTVTRAGPAPSVTDEQPTATTAVAASVQRRNQDMCAR